MAYRNGCGHRPLPPSRGRSRRGTALPDAVPLVPRRLCLVSCPASNNIPAGNLPRQGAIMSVELVRDFFLWCAIINYGLLLVWALLLMLPHDWLYRLWRRRIRLSAEQ